MAEDELGEWLFSVSWEAVWQGEVTQGTAVRSTSELTRLYSALLHDVPGSIVPPLTPQTLAGSATAAGTMASRLLRHPALQTSRALVAWCVDIEAFHVIASELVPSTTDDLALALALPKLADSSAADSATAHEASIRLALASATERADAELSLEAPSRKSESDATSVIADILAWRREQEQALNVARKWAAGAAVAARSAAALRFGLISNSKLLDGLLAPEAVAQLAGLTSRAGESAVASLSFDGLVVDLDDLLGSLRSIALAAQSVERLRSRANVARSTAGRTALSHHTRSARLTSAAKRDAEADELGDETYSNSARSTVLRAYSSLEVVAAKLESDEHTLDEANKLVADLDERSDFARARFTSEVAGFLEQFLSVRFRIARDFLRAEQETLSLSATSAQEALASLGGGGASDV